MIVPSKDIDHLRWIYARMIYEHKEDPNTDYMIRFYEVIRNLERMPRN